MSEACPGCGQIMEHGFLQTGGGTAAFVKEPRMLMLREDQGDIRLPVSRLTKACPAWYCARGAESSSSPGGRKMPGQSWSGHPGETCSRKYGGCCGVLYQQNDR